MAASEVMPTTSLAVPNGVPPTPEIIKEKLMEKLRCEKMRSIKVQEAQGGGGAVKRRRKSHNM